MRDSKGRFIKGSTNKGGRPKGSGKLHVKEICWSALERIARLVFESSEKDMVKWLRDNSDKLTRAEKVFLSNSKDLKSLQSLLDRIIGKAKQAVDVTSDGEKIESAAPAITVYIPKNGREKKD